MARLIRLGMVSSIIADRPQSRGTATSFNAFESAGDTLIALPSLAAATAVIPCEASTRTWAYQSVLEPLWESAPSLRTSQPKAYPPPYGGVCKVRHVSRFR